MTKHYKDGTTLHRVVGRREFMGETFVIVETLSPGWGRVETIHERALQHLELCSEPEWLAMERNVAEAQAKLKADASRKQDAERFGARVVITGRSDQVWTAVIERCTATRFVSTDGYAWKRGGRDCWRADRW